MSMVVLLLSDSMPFLFAGVGLVVIYVSWRTITGFRKFKAYKRSIEEDGLLRAQRWVLIRMKFPLIRRITFSHAYLTRKRFILFHFFTRRMILQAPLGPKGRAGTEKGRFETMAWRGRSLLVLRTTLCGGGRVKIHVSDGAGWHRDIVKEGDQ